jgi:aconitate hydratase
MSYERIHRSNLVGMGIVPLQYLEGQTASSLGLTGKETYSITIFNNISAIPWRSVLLVEETGVPGKNH